MNIKEAKELYFEYRCSKFAMGRNAWDKYVEYNDLSIPQKTENVWRNEYLDEVLKEYHNNGSYHLFIEIIELNCLDITKESLECINREFDNLHCDNREKLIVAELLVGRTSSQKDGVLVKALLKGYTDLAKDIYGKTELLLNSVKKDDETNQRLISDIRKLQAIETNYIKRTS